MLLSALDFPFCFVAVRMLGTERIGRWEGVVVEWFWWGVGSVVPEGTVVGNAVVGQGEVGVGVGVPVGVGAGIDHGVQEAEERNKREDASELIPIDVAG